MAAQIEKHHDDDDIQKLSISWDISNWEEKLETIAEEITLFANLISAYTNSKEGKSVYENLLQKLETLKVTNGNFHKNLIDYNLKLEGLKECEDLQCETYFLNGHAQFKENIEAFFSKYRKTKKSLFAKLNNSVYNKQA